MRLLALGLILLMAGCASQPVSATLDTMDGTFYLKQGQMKDGTAYTLFTQRAVAGVGDDLEPITESNTQRFLREQVEPEIDRGDKMNKGVINDNSSSHYLRAIALMMKRQMEEKE